MNELATALGVFTDIQPLSPSKMDPDRLFISSRINPMAGRVAFERMTCDAGVYVRVRVNNAVYPLKECRSGPGKMCELKEFGKVIKAKVDRAGDVMKRYDPFLAFILAWTTNPSNFRCGLSPNQTISNGQTTIFWDTKLPWIKAVQP